MSTSKILKLEERPFKVALDEIVKVNTLKKIEDALTGNEAAHAPTYLHHVTKRIAKLVRSADRQESTKEFKARINMETRFGRLNNLRNKYVADANAERLRIVSKRLQNLLHEGQLKVTRRKPDTGKRVEKTFTYANSSGNKKLNRVGTEYKRMVWEEAEYEQVDRGVRKKRIKVEKDPDAPKTTNMWISSITRAKEEIGAPAFLIVRREVKDPSDPNQKLGVELYKRAKEIMAELKEEAAKSAVVEVPMETN